MAVKLNFKCQGPGAIIILFCNSAMQLGQARDNQAPQICAAVLNEMVVYC